MSTLPGQSAWRDAGLVENEDEIVTLADNVEREPSDAAEYRPKAPRPDLEGKANEADVAEQAAEVPTSEERDR